MSDRHATRGGTPNVSAGESVVIARLLNLRQHQQEGKRSPHKPLLVLLALARFAAVGSSALTWSDARHSLGALLVEFGPASTTSPTQAAAYPFTRLRSDGLWTLDQDVPMDRLGPLEIATVTGQFVPSIEEAIRDRQVLNATARALVESEFPPSIAGDVLAAVGLDPDEIYSIRNTMSAEASATRRRSADWPRRILSAWDRQCAFCGFDGQLGMASVGLEAAHVRWFNFGGPDSLDNGIALCALHHKLFDRGALGLTDDYRIVVSSIFTARTDAGRRVYELADRPLRPRPGTSLPAAEHMDWHTTQVFKEGVLAGS